MLLEAAIVAFGKAGRPTPIRGTQTQGDGLGPRLIYIDFIVSFLEQTLFTTIVDYPRSTILAK